SPAAAERNLSSLGLPSTDHTAAPPAQPISTGGSSRERELGSLLVLNARPVVPSGPIAVPEGNRPGEFAASPEGRPGATARPEIKSGNSPSAANGSVNSAGPADIYVAPPAAQVTATAVVAALPPTARPLPPDKTEGQPRDRIDTQIFGTRR